MLSRQFLRAEERIAKLESQLPMECGHARKFLQACGPTDVDPMERTMPVIDVCSECERIAALMAQVAVLRKLAEMWTHDKATIPLTSTRVCTVGCHRCQIEAALKPTAAEGYVAVKKEEWENLKREHEEAFKGMEDAMGDKPLVMIRVSELERLKRLEVMPNADHGTRQNSGSHVDAGDHRAAEETSDRSIDDSE